MYIKKFLSHTLSREVLKSVIRCTVYVPYATWCTLEDYIGVFSDSFNFITAFNVLST